jgi:hypothetical protein
MRHLIEKLETLIEEKGVSVFDKFGEVDIRKLRAKVKRALPRDCTFASIGESGWAQISFDRGGAAEHGGHGEERGEIDVRVPPTFLLRKGQARGAVSVRYSPSPTKPGAGRAWVRQQFEASRGKGADDALVGKGIAWLVAQMKKARR